VQDDVNGDWDIYVRDVASGALTRANVDEFGDEAQPNLVNQDIGSATPALAGNGQVVAFVTDSPSLAAFSRFPGVSENDFTFHVDNAPPALGDTVVRTTLLFEDLNRIIGTSGPDVIRGTQRGDLIDGLAGSDVIFGLKGEDRLIGREGNDRIEGNRSHDFIDGGPGDDRLFGGRGADRIRGGEGNDFLNGGRGPDKLDGGPGDDRLLGGPGDDRLEGGAGNDILEGGPGSDHFVYDRFSWSVGVRNPDDRPQPRPDDETIGRDRIVDFMKGDDKIVLINFDFILEESVEGGSQTLFSGLFDFSDLDIRPSADGRSSVIDLSEAFQNAPGTDLITVIGVTNLDASDFLFQ
jgi:Ca2+-binding RTX toxin-like protein